MKACPVCGKVGLTGDEGACPQCNADLECFDLLDSLHEEVVTPKQYKTTSIETKDLAQMRASLRDLREAVGNLQASSRLRHYGL